MVICGICSIIINVQCHHYHLQIDNSIDRIQCKLSLREVGNTCRLLMVLYM